jgi:hypothetical protein
MSETYVKDLYKRSAHSTVSKLDAAKATVVCGVRSERLQHQARPTHHPQ